LRPGGESSCGKFNIDEVLRNILNILDKYDIKAVFNTLGILAENYRKWLADCMMKGMRLHRMVIDMKFCETGNFRFD